MNNNCIVQGFGGAVLACLIFAAAVRTEELKGQLKEVKTGGNCLVVTILGKDREFEVPASAKIFDARSGAIGDRLQLKGSYKGRVTITTADRDGKAEVQLVRLTDYYLNRPAEFYLDPDQAGPDLHILGEYEGTAGDSKLGAQVVVEDNGRFVVHFLPGGLPGAGWDGKTKVATTAATVDGKTTITGTWTGEIAAGKLSGKTANGQAFALTRVVRQSPTLGAKPPPGALVLFDGTGTDHFPKAKMSADKLLTVPATSKQRFHDLLVHLEFVIPYRGPSRGNSGVYLQGCYEIQILDSFGGGASPSGCGGLYVVRKPDVNMALPPLSWQTLDVDYTAARFDADGKMLRQPIVTVRHNGVVIHNHISLPMKGNGGQPTPEGGPLYLQNHGSPVRFRNIWVVEKNETK